MPVDATTPTSTTCSSRSAWIRRPVSDRQNCGNLLAATAPFAVERGIVGVDPTATTATVRVYMVNTDSIADSTFEVRDGMPVYRGTASIDGVPGHRRADPDRLRRHRGRVVRRAAPDWSRRRHHRRRRADVDRQRHAGRGDAGERPRHHRHRVAGRARRRRRVASEARVDPAPGRPADAPRRRLRDDRSEADDGFGTHGGWRRLDAHVHPASLPRCDRRARRGLGGDRRAAAGHARIVG